MPEITCPCGTLVDTEAITGERCPICCTDLRDYKAAHVPARPETDEGQGPRYTDRCPECGNRMVRAEGCAKCMACGNSLCG